MSYSVEKADILKDKDRILKFWETNFPTWPSARIGWLYEKNIYGRAECWTIRNENANQALGAAAVFPRRFWLKGRYVMAGITGDFAVDKGHRVVGPALQLQRAVIGSCKKGKYEFLYGFPNSRSEPIQKRAGFQKVGSAARLVKVLKVDDHLARIVNRPLLLSLLSPITNMFLRIVAKETRFIISKRYSGEVISEIDSRFDDLWKKARNNFSIMGERTSEFLKWKFSHCPYRNHGIFILRRRDNHEVLGYVIYYINDSHVHIADFLFCDDCDTFDNLFSAFLKYLRKKKYHSVSVIYFGSREIEKKLKTFNFSKRDDARSIIFYLKPESHNGCDMSEKDNWFFLEADND